MTVTSVGSRRNRCCLPTLPWIDISRAVTVVTNPPRLPIFGSWIRLRLKLSSLSWSHYCLSSLVSLGLFICGTCPRFGEKELITRAFKVENFSFQAPYFSEIQHVRKMRFKNLDGEVRHLWGPAGMCRLPSAECTLTRAVHRAHKLEHTFLLVFRLFLLFLATALNFLEEKKLVYMFRWLLQKTCFHDVCQDVEWAGLSQLLWLPTLVQHVLHSSSTALLVLGCQTLLCSFLLYCSVLHYLTGRFIKPTKYTINMNFDIWQKINLFRLLISILPPVTRNNL